MRRLDIGVASYRNPAKLRATLQSIRNMSVTDWKCLIIHNNTEGEDNAAALSVTREACEIDKRFWLYEIGHNAGYAGAINRVFSIAQTEYIAYLDNDVEILTPGWDETLCSYLDRFHEIGLMVPNGGAYQIPRGPYTEVEWAAGFAFVVSRICMKDTGNFDEAIGHQNECDYMMRARMAGYKVAAAPEVAIAHHATATNDPKSIERISRGVVEFVNKWNRYFNGKNFNYHSTNVTRWEDWPPNALYMEEWWKTKTADMVKPDHGLFPLYKLNDDPDVAYVDGREYDLIRVPRFKDFYRGRII